ncbi:MAG TPA: hypothetical protein HPP90_13370 [Deltaproteobacteria bacterium]|nr:hypothetical protein [Deltaproteobacteria bacterium]
MIGLSRNIEIGDMFGISHTAVSHIVKTVKGKMRSDGDYRKKYALIHLGVVDNDMLGSTVEVTGLADGDRLCVFLTA